MIFRDAGIVDNLFHPPFCPNPRCSLHGSAAGTSWWIRSGTHSTKAFGLVPRFRCLRCGRTFSRQTFRLDFYAKKTVSYSALKSLLCSGKGVRASARSLSVSPATVQNRVYRLSRQAVAFLSLSRDSLALREVLSEGSWSDKLYSRRFSGRTWIASGLSSRLVHAWTAGFASLGSQTPAAPASVLAGLLSGCSRRASRPPVLRTGTVSSFKAALQGTPFCVAHRTGADRDLLKGWIADLRTNLSDRVPGSPCFARNLNYSLARLSVFLHGRCFSGNRDQDWASAGYSVRDLRVWEKSFHEWRWFLTRTDVPPWYRGVWLKRVPTPMDFNGGYVPLFCGGSGFLRQKKLRHSSSVIKECSLTDSDNTS